VSRQSNANLLNCIWWLGIPSNRSIFGAARNELLVLVCAIAVFVPGIVSPPHLMDDVDAVQAQIARNMLDSGDWVSAQLDGVKYLEKAPLPYWLMAVSYAVLGVHDWVARLPLVLSVIALCWVTARFGRWAFGAQSGFYAGLVLATCVGLFLFTRMLIPDAMVTLAVTVSMWAFLRVLEEDEPHPQLWVFILAASLGVGLLLKGLIALVFPTAAALLYLVFTRQLFSGRTWMKLRPLSGLALLLLIAAPWHVLAIMRNPPYFDFTMKSEPGNYHGFFWFYFLNEHLFRFLNLRYPRDYNTVPRAYFWLFQLLWLFPWSVYLPAALRQDFRPTYRAGRTRLLALCWIGFVMLFFTFSTTQEYYSMPIYPALALLIGATLSAEAGWLRWGTRVIALISTIAAVSIAAILIAVRNLPTPGDIAAALNSNPRLYTLSLGHMADLTIHSFAYLRTPLVLAGLAFLVGATALWRFAGTRAYVAAALMMVLFFQAARLALVAFDPYLSSQTLAQALVQAPKGELIVDDQYYTFSSIFFYANRRALLFNGRVNNLVYGSYAPGAPQVFIDDTEFRRLWSAPERFYLVVEGPKLARIRGLVGAGALHVVRESGGKFLLCNQELAPFSSIDANGPGKNQLN
jgi:4-amino-4-deoxy-L-arabinose transferase-like glycosyltransferase